ncbi:MAG: hypothetical protein GY862_25430 [Gammaproteobacteria bacterium]|nr:hypothetical protein [Gammaproteobacteria bacterium]
MKVKIKEHIAAYPELEHGITYKVIGMEAGDLRLWSDKSPPYLYPTDIFEMTDPAIPEDWVTEYDEDGGFYAYPVQLNEAGFFEDYFDRDITAIRRLHAYLFETKSPLQTLKNCLTCGKTTS